MQDYRDSIAWLAGYHIAGISLLDIALALAAAVASYALMLLGLRLVTGRLRKLAERTTTPMDDMVVSVLASTNRWLLLAAADRRDRFADPPVHKKGATSSTGWQRNGRPAQLSVQAYGSARRPPGSQRARGVHAEDKDRNR